MPLREPTTVDLDCLFCGRATEHRVMRVPSDGPRQRRSAEPQRSLAVCISCGGGMPLPAVLPAAPPPVVVPEPRDVEPTERLRASECHWPAFWV